MFDDRLIPRLFWLILVFSLCRPDGAFSALAGVDSQGHAELVGIPTAPVTIDGRVLFRLRGISSFPAEERTMAVSERIKDAAADPTVEPGSLQVEESEAFSTIKAGDLVLVRIVNADAELEGVERHTLAQALQVRIWEGINFWRSNRDPEKLKRSVLVALGATLLLVFVLALGHWIYRRLRRWIEGRLQGKVRDVKIQKFKLVRRDQLWRLLESTLGLIWIVFVLVASYLYLYGVLSLFPWTRRYANNLFHVLVEPLKVLGLGLVKEFPNLVFLVILFLALRFFLKVVRLFFSRVADGSVPLPNFEAEWAWPTYKLLRLLLVVLALIIAYPYIPGSDTGAFKGVSLFIGLLFSLGSSSLIGNVVAGYTMTYRRAFREGDRIRIGEHIGDVDQRRLLVTHLRSLKNEEVVIPNSTILNSEIVNFSTLARQQGVILHTTVGIGYETPWRQVEAMLLEAASRTSRILPKPAPYVLQKGLGDFCVTYEINVYCAEPGAMDTIYTDLHRNILDAFNEYGVQIMTPAYERDPEQPKVVPKEEWYAPPAKSPGQKESIPGFEDSKLAGQGGESSN